MSLLPLRKFVASDADLLCPDAVDASLRNNETYWKEWAVINEKSGPAYTCLHKGRPIGAAGIRLCRLKDSDEQVGWVWMVVSNRVSECPVSFVLTVRTMLTILVKEFNLSRLVSESRKGFEKSQRFLEHLGFVKTDAEDETHFIYEMRT